VLAGLARSIREWHFFLSNASYLALFFQARSLALQIEPAPRRGPRRLRFARALPASTRVRTSFTARCISARPNSDCADPTPALVDQRR